jgi:hypothetical protein
VKNGRSEVVKVLLAAEAGMERQDMVSDVVIHGAVRAASDL